MRNVFIARAPQKGNLQNTLDAQNQATQNLAELQNQEDAGPKK